MMLAFTGHLTIACALLFAAAVLDVLDGLAARALGGGSPLGAQLDSLADMVSFGMAPAFLLYSRDAGRDGAVAWVTALAALALVIASCWRLARFNVDTRQATGFLGLPTPANGLFWTSMLLADSGVGVCDGPGAGMLAALVATVLGTPVVLLASALVLAVIMCSSLPLPSLKLTRSGWRGNEVIALLALSGMVLAGAYGTLAVPAILLLYLTSPLWGRVINHRSAATDHRAQP